MVVGEDMACCDGVIQGETLPKRADDRVKETMDGRCTDWVDGEPSQSGRSKMTYGEAVLRSTESWGNFERAWRQAVI